MSTKHTEIVSKFTVKRDADSWISGFLLLGVLVGLPGSLLIAWQYHLEADPKLIGLHFLSLNAGYVIAVACAQPLLLRISMRTVALLSCLIAAGSLGGLSLAAPPVWAIWRVVGLGFVGFAGGLLAACLLYALEPHFKRSAAASTNLAGLWFGCGCLYSTFIVGASYFAGSVHKETALLGVVPLVFLFVFALSRSSIARGPVQVCQEENQLRDTLRDLRSIAAVLFSVLLFFQFGNEWAIAGWLPLFLIHRLGTNPVWAIATLAVYFLALIVGRLASQWLLRRISHRKLLLASTFVAMAGYLLLSLTASMAIAVTAVVIIGAAFAPIYPLIAETLDDRFSYHPGFYNGLFSVAMTGAMMAPWLLGYVDDYLGMQYVMLVPAIGSVIVLVIALLIMLEAHVMGGKSGDQLQQRAAVASGN